MRASGEPDATALPDPHLAHGRFARAEREEDSAPPPRATVGAGCSPPSRGSAARTASYRRRRRSKTTTTKGRAGGRRPGAGDDCSQTRGPEKSGVFFYDRLGRARARMAMDGGALAGERGQPARASVVQRDGPPSARVAHVHHKRLENASRFPHRPQPRRRLQFFFRDPDPRAAAPPPPSTFRTVFSSTPTARPIARKLIPSRRIRLTSTAISWKRNGSCVNTANVTSTSATVRIGCRRVH